MLGKYVRKDAFGNIGGVSSYWRFYTELPSGIKLVEKGNQPQREPDEENTWYASAFSHGGIITKTWNLNEQELAESIEAAFESSLVYVGIENIDAAIDELNSLGFLSTKNGWEDKGYITRLEI